MFIISIRSIVLKNEHHVKRGVDIAITAGQLAEMTGLTRETVSRTLKGLQQEGVVALRRGVITLVE